MNKILIFTITLLLFNLISYSQLQVSQFSHKGSLYLKSHNENSLEIRSTQDTIEGLIINVDKYKVFDAVFSKDDQFFFTCGREGVVRKFDTKGRLIKSYGQSIYSLNTLLLDETNGYVISGSGLGYIHIWNEESGKLLNSIRISDDAISSSFLLNGNIILSTFQGEIFQVNPKTLAFRKLGEFKDLEIYDLLPSSNNFLVASCRKVTKEYNQIGLSTFNLSTNKASSQFLVLGELDKYSESNFNAKTSLHLKPFANNDNQYTLLSSLEYYSLVNGELEIHPTQLAEKLAKDDNYTDISNAYWDYSIMNNVGANYYSGDLAYLCDGDLYYGKIYHLDTSIYNGLVTNLSEEQINLDNDLKLIIPNAILLEIDSLRSNRGIEEEGITPLIQNNFQFLNECVISSDSQRIAITNESQMIKVFDLKKKRLIANLTTDSKILRLIKHPYAPLLASLQIDGSICLWDFENYRLLNKYQAIDNSKYQKYFEKEYGSYHHDSSPLLYARRFNNSDANNLSFEFSELGDEIRFFQWSIPNECVLFNRVNFLTGKTYLLTNPIYTLAAEDGYRNKSITVDIKGYTDFLSKVELEESYGTNGRHAFFEENIRKYESEQDIIVDLWRNLGDDFHAEVPATHSSQDGNIMILDYATKLYAVDTKTMNVSVLDLNTIQSKYSIYSDSAIIDRPDELFVPRTKYFQNCFFKVRRYIDTSYAITSEDYKSSYYKKSIPEIDLTEMSGRDVLSTDNSADEWLYQYYIEEYYAWNLTDQSITPITTKEYNGNYIQKEEDQFTDDDWEEREFQLEEEEMALEMVTGPGNWSEFNDEDYVMMTESYQRSSNLFRPGYSDKMQSVNLQDGNYHTTLYLDNSILIRKGKSKKYCIIPSQTSTIANQEYLKATDLLVTTNVNGEIHLWDWQQKPTTPLLSFIGSRGELFAMTPEFYYMAITPGANNIAFRKNGETFGFEQFDLKFNRPDIVLKQFKGSDPNLISAYHQAYLKRLKKMNFTEEMLKDDFHLPEIEIKNFEAMPTIIDENNIDLNLHLEDSKYPLDRINIWVNDVAIFGTNGISLRDLNTQKLDKVVTIPLAKGKNKIQVSALNQAGAESYKETLELKCTIGKDQPNLYLITIGESEFKQADFNLTYPAKDAQDVAHLFAKSKVYNEVFSKTLTNNEVTKEKILELKSFLNQADINDHVMIFLAGHGVLSADLDYYLATYDMDFNKPEDRGLMYDDLENLLDGIKPLSKTLIIDACHSGEIDKEEMELAVAENTEEGDVQFRAVNHTVKSKLGSQNTLELTKSLFTDLRKGTGATVISSAGGMEFAMESGDWQNGLFTYALLNGIKSGNADLNKDGEIWLSELQLYVGEKVTKMSNGLQQPTSRIENQMVDFRVW